ncbi:hypothetical protein HHI36_013445 [Cryptolaemus montrouzieri]|uniref:Uncharacterized protein n=1 Tax=Cryptolaemus montrouzieri TaxID=559131 RepID=A0ABD2NHA4_9CUCU
MVRNRGRKTDIDLTNKDVLMEAVKSVLAESRSEKEMLAGYLIKCTRLHHGLPIMVARKFALADHKAIPQTWTHEKNAEKDRLSLRTPKSNFSCEGNMIQ